MKKIILLAVILPLAFNCNKGRTYGGLPAETEARTSAPPPSSAGFANPERPDLYYFFDRTESMRGFFTKGDDSDCVRALRAMWQAAEFFPGNVTHIYDYGDSWTREYKESAVSKAKEQVLKESFYGIKDVLPESDGYCDWVKDNNKRPFASVAEYIKTIDSTKPKLKNSACIIVTDLYEFGVVNPFARFFGDAFADGMSGAVFAVESSFSGTIESVSVTGNENKNVRVSAGTATFFICVTGDSAVVAGWSTALVKEFSRNNITFQSSVFMIRQGEDIKPISSRPIPANRREFTDAKNTLKSMNIDSDNSGRSIQSYRLLPSRENSRWSAGLPLSNINFDNFDYEQNSEIYFSKIISGGRSQVGNNADFSVKTYRAKNNPLYIVIETRNKSLSAGYYKIDYKIVPKAKAKPLWVTNLNAADIAELEESVKSGGRVKVLDFANVYARIADSYNNIKNKNIYAGELHLLKK